MTSPKDLPAVPDGDEKIESDFDAGTGPAHNVQAPEGAGPSPADAAAAANPSGGPAIEVDPVEQDDVQGGRAGEG